MSIMVFVFCLFSIYEPVRNDGQTDTRTDGRAKRVMRPIGRPHNNNNNNNWRVVVYRPISLISISLEVLVFVWVLILDLSNVYRSKLESETQS